MIELKHLGKIYSSASGSVEALKDVNLTIADGEIFGIIGCLLYTSPSPRD